MASVAQVRLDGTAPRAEILIHAGNFAGDIDKGLRSDVEGCILLGGDVGRIKGQRAVLLSRAAVSRFHAAMEQRDFMLEILPVETPQMFGEPPGALP